MKRLILSLLILLTSMSAWAYDFEAKNADGVTIYYNLLSATECEVTCYDVYRNSATYGGSVVIPSSVVYRTKTISVTAIGYQAFVTCSSLTSVTIPNSVTEIKGGAFSNCSSLTSIAIPNSVTTIGQSVFYSCSSLKSINIPNSVTKIGYLAFERCSCLEKLRSYKADPSQVKLDDRSFDYNAGLIPITLEVPQGSKGKYQQAKIWKDFWEIVEFDANDEQPIDPEQKVCAKPTIKYADGHIDFGCETEDVKFISQITDADAKTYDSSSINLTGNITISVYATKEGFSNSETATATLCWLNVTNPGQSLTSIQSRPAIIAPSTDGYSIEMDPEDAQAVGNRVEFYTPQGTYLGAEQLRDGRAFFETNEPLVIIRIGSQSLKVSR